MTITKRIETLPSILEDKTAYQYLVLLAIILLAIVLRLYGLGQWSFWIDEILTIQRAQVHILEAESIKYWRQPPSLFLIAGALRLLGENEWSARIGPALLGVITIPVLYFPIRRMLGPIVGLIASLLLAVAPWHIFWSQNARFYSSLFLLYSLAYFALYFALDENRPWLILASLIFFFLGFRERVVAAFFIPVALSYIFGLKLLRFRLPPGYNKRNLALFLFPILGYLLYTLYLFAIGGNPPIVDSVRGFWGRPIDDPARVLILVTFNIGLALAAFAFLSGIYLLLERRRTGLFLMVGAIVPPLLLAMANPFFFTVDRYVFMSLSSWIILAAYGIKEVFSRLEGNGSLLTIGVLFVLLLDAAGAHLMYYQINEGNRLDWRTAMQIVDEKQLDGESVVSTRVALAAYYLDEEVIDLRQLGAVGLEQLSDRTWFVVDSEGLGHVGADTRNWLEENGELIEVLYLRVRENINLQIYRYDPDVESGHKSLGAGKSRDK